MQGREGDLVLVNGQHQPVLSARPGERERWRVVNACSSRYLRLHLQAPPGQPGQDLQLLGLDSGRMAAPRPVGEVLLAPGNRADLLLTASEGDTLLQALSHDRGAMPGMGGGGDDGAPAPAMGEPLTLARLRARGAPAPAPGPVATHRAPRDLREATVSAHRDITLGMGMGTGMGMGSMGTGSGDMMAFTINGRAFDPERTDQVAAAGTVEQWTLHNTTPMDHPFHLHTWPMQILARGGRPQQDVTWRDVVDVPAHTTVTVRIAFDRHTGRTVHHCHVLDHEDAGMMAVVQVH